jgi:sodium/potassium/calcium exchanger 6
MVALYLLYVVVVIVMNVMATEKRRMHTPAEHGSGGKSLPGAQGTFGAITPISSRASSLRLPSPGLEDATGDEASAGSLTPTGIRPHPNPHQRRSSHSLTRPRGRQSDTPDYAETPRANFSLLGAIEFRDVVNSLKREGASRTPSPGRSPYTAVERTDYFTAGHRRSVSHVPARRTSLQNRSRAISHVVQPGNMATFSMTPSEMPSTRMKPARIQTAPGLVDTGASGQTEETSMSPTSSTDNPWKDQNGNPPARPLLPKLSIPSPKLLPFKKKSHGTTPSISIMDPSGHVEEPIFSPPTQESTPLSTPYTRSETRFRFRHRTRMILRVLFPSLQSFRHKSYFGQILSVFSVPAILVLTITLPVVDDGNQEGGIALRGRTTRPRSRAWTRRCRRRRLVASRYWRRFASSSRWRFFAAPFAFGTDISFFPTGRYAGYRGARWSRGNG